MYKTLGLRQVKVNLNAKKVGIRQILLFVLIYDLRSHLNSKKFSINLRIMHQIYVEKIRQFAVVLVILHAIKDLRSPFIHEGA
jgi:hypothetical protein